MYEEIVKNLLLLDRIIKALLPPNPSSSRAGEALSHLSPVLQRLSFGAPGCDFISGRFNVACSSCFSGLKAQFSF